MEIRTERLLLRELKIEDWVAIAAYQSDPEVRRQLLWRQRSARAAQRFVESAIKHACHEPRVQFAFAVILPELLPELEPPQKRDPKPTDGKQQPVAIAPIGIAVLHRIPHNQAIIGWELDKMFWGRGYATEVAHELLGLGFQTLQLEHILGECFASNAASRKVMEKIGMQCLTAPGWDSWRLAFRYLQIQPVVRYYISHSDWLKQQPPTSSIDTSSLNSGSINTTSVNTNSS